MAAPSDDVDKYRLGLSQAYMKLPAKDNFPDYSKHKCMVARHLTLEVGHIFIFSTLFYVLLGTGTQGPYQFPP